MKMGKSICSFSSSSPPLPAFSLFSRRRRIALTDLAVGLALVVTACGYHAVYGAGAPPKLHVVLARTMIADVVASDEVVAGLREELARAGAVHGVVAACRNDKSQTDC